MLVEFRNVFNFYDLEVVVRSKSEELYKRLNLDFSNFIVEDPSEVFLEIECFKESPPLDRIGNAKITRTSSNSITHDQGPIRFNNYFEQGLTIFDYDVEKSKIYSLDIEFLHELTYLIILSRVGKRLDLLGLHRIHAMGVQIGDVSCLCMFPMGGGKSTLLANLLNYDDVKIISDDSPLINTRGEFLNFAIRLGVAPELIKNIKNPDENIYSLTRRQYGKKELISLEGISNELASKSKRQVLIQGKRIKGSTSRLHKARLDQKIYSLMINMVIGIGLPMIFEYFWENGFTDFLRKSKIACLRFFAMIRVLFKSDFYIFETGDEPIKNAKILYEFLKEKS
ncbi:hypothetical protein A9Q84_19810 [Halobacteriovorax marinus]|uniref:Uncharacterized protein n=1 Tax=Halobacteriovorax marinus TaxID=97084 RepID=A0A1Y5F964_9BACT|nr:hypothetical protein A9Q84_19810 [Halobacteriovorax marinus]